MAIRKRFRICEIMELYDISFYKVNQMLNKANNYTYFTKQKLIGEKKISVTEVAQILDIINHLTGKDFDITDLQWQPVYLRFL